MSKKVVRIIALIMAILLGLSAIGMIAMYVAAETPDVVSASCAAPISTLIASETAQIYNIISLTA